METFENINIICTIFFSWCLETHADPLFTLLQVKLLALSRDRARVFQATDSEVLGGTYFLKTILSVHLLSFLSLAFILWRLKKGCVSSYTRYITRRLTMCLVLCRVFTCIVSFNPSSTLLRWVMLLSSVYKSGNWDMGGLTTLLIPTAGVIWPLLGWWPFPSFLHRELEGGGQNAHSGSTCLSVHSDPPHLSCLHVQLQSSVMAALLPSDFLSFWKIIFTVIIRIYSDRSEHFTCFFLFP